MILMISCFKNNFTIYFICTTILLKRKACMFLPHFRQLKKKRLQDTCIKWYYRDVKYASKYLINAWTLHAFYCFFLIIRTLQYMLIS